MMKYRDCRACMLFFATFTVLAFSASGGEQLSLTYGYQEMTRVDNEGATSEKGLVQKAVTDTVIAYDVEVTIDDSVEMKRRFIVSLIPKLRLKLGVVDGAFAKGDKASYEYSVDEKGVVTARADPEATGERVHRADGREVSHRIVYMLASEEDLDVDETEYFLTGLRTKKFMRKDFSRYLSVDMNLVIRAEMRERSEKMDGHVINDAALFVTRENLVKYVQSFKERRNRGVGK
jgi:hypothetical protein